MWTCLVRCHVRTGQHTLSPGRTVARIGGAGLFAALLRVALGLGARVKLQVQHATPAIECIPVVCTIRMPDRIMKISAFGDYHLNRESAGK